MNEVRNILIGYELGAETSQISYYDRSLKDAVSVPARVGSNLYSFPTSLLKARGEDEWHFGFEADYFEKRGEGIPVRNLTDKLGTGFTLSVDGKKLGAADLLAVFFRESLKLLGLKDPLRSIGGIAVTADDLTAEKALQIRRALGMAGFSPDRCFVLSLPESFYYYGYSQKPDVWTRGMMLIRFAGDNVTCDRLTEQRVGKPHTVSVTRRGEASLPRESEARDAAFSRLVKEWSGGILCSGLFITGNGFKREWAKQSIKALGSAASHVYEGDNLFVKGACLAVYEKLEHFAFADRIFLSSHLVRASLGVDVLDRGKPVTLPLIRAGVSWYENETACELVIDDSPEAGSYLDRETEEERFLMLTLSPMGRGRHRNIRFPLQGFPSRAGGAFRVLLTARCLGADSCEVRARDLGFGELFPASGAEAEITVSLSEVDA